MYIVSKEMKALNKEYIKKGSINIYGLVLIMLALITATGCKKFVEVPDPITNTTYSNVYTDDASAISVTTGMFANLSNGSAGSPQLLSLSVYGGLSADEFSLMNNPSNRGYVNYYRNMSDSRGTEIYTDFWTNSYQLLYVANSVIGALDNSSAITPAVRKQLMGEAKFMRAFCYFYLVNLYGDVPLITGIDHNVNITIPRTPKAQVYQLIVDDLKEAKGLLSENYLDGKLLPYNVGMEEKVRPTKWAASALLARTYLYLKDWQNAITESSLVINHSAFQLSTLANVFLKNSTEAIWQLQSVAIGRNTIWGPAFILTAAPDQNKPITLSTSLKSSFETDDARLTDWVGERNVTTGGVTTTFYFPYKYKVYTYNSPVTEYEMVLRLGEQYLIRAEAEAELENTTDAAEDLYQIRDRAGLGKITGNKATLLTAIEKERRVELFSEWGHRWLDLKRTGRIDAVMSVATPLKGGGTWDTRHQLYEISAYELLNNRSLTPNPGY